MHVSIAFREYKETLHVNNVCEIGPFSVGTRRFAHIANSTVPVINDYNFYSDAANEKHLSQSHMHTIHQPTVQYNWVIRP